MEEDNSNELYHYGVPGMRWGVRKSINDRIVQIRKNKAIERNNKIQKQNPNSKKALKSERETYQIVNSKYGRSNSQLRTEAALRKIGSVGIQSASALSLIASGAVLTNPALAIVGGVTIGAAGSIHRKMIDRSTTKKLEQNLLDTKYKGQ